MTGNALFSARLSTSAKLSIYGELMTQYKHEHKATVVALADDALGHGFSFNAPASKQVGPDQVIYCIAERRIVQADMSGGQPVPALRFMQPLTADS